jgi:FkbM family methyltransferase
LGGEPDLPQVAFVLAATENGPMILNRLDYCRVAGGGYAGVGASLLGTGSHEQGDIEELFGLLVAHREAYGDGVVVIDGGANIGTHTLAWAKAMAGWGSVLAFEPQERVFYALAGNIALNNCFNAKATMAALADVLGTTPIVKLDHEKPANFGGLSLRFDLNGAIGQPLGVNEACRLVTIDSLNLTRLDLLKLDIEGTEPAALDGAYATIVRCRPIIFAEIALCGAEEVKKRLSGYRFIPAGMSILAIHESDKVLEKIRIVGG